MPEQTYKTSLITENIYIQEIESEVSDVAGTPQYCASLGKVLLCWGRLPNPSPDTQPGSGPKGGGTVPELSHRSLLIF